MDMISTVVFSIGITSHIGLEPPGDDKWNYIHPEVAVHSGDYRIGAYLNSLTTLSLYGARNFNITPKIDVQVGLASGYIYTITPYVKMDYKINSDINLFIAPAAQKLNKTDDYQQGVVVGLQYKF